MEGAPSAVDLFDPKPELDKNHGKRIAIDVFNGNPGPLMKSPFTFRQYGQSGAWVCEKYPNVAKHVDDIAFVKSCFTESNDHVPALYQMNTGIARRRVPDRRAPGSPTAWAARTRTCPGSSCSGTRRASRAGRSTGAPGSCPTTYQGTLFRSQGSPILNLKRPQDVADEDQRAQLDLLARLNGEHLSRSRGRARPLGADRDVRAGLPHADGGDRPRRLLAGNGGDAQTVRPRRTRSRGRSARSA